MKLNFWQWLGVIVFVIALAVILWREVTGTTPTKPVPPPPPLPAATQPAK